MSPSNVTHALPEISNFETEMSAALMRDCKYPRRPGSRVPRTRAPARRTPNPMGPNCGKSASLIGRLGSSAFRLSTTAVSMSLAGSCFSSESAPGPFHHGIRGRGGTIFWAALPAVARQVQADMRTHLIHRPARDIFPPLGGARAFSYRV